MNRGQNVQQEKRSFLTRLTRETTGESRQKKQYHAYVQLILCFLLVPFSPTHVAAEDQPLEIARITRSGTDVPAGKRIVIQFNQPVVPLGRMARSADEIPVTITPEVKCQWRWLSDCLSRVI